MLSHRRRPCGPPGTALACGALVTDARLLILDDDAHIGKMVQLIAESVATSPACCPSVSRRALRALLVGRRGKILRWNQNFMNVSGYSADEIANMHASEFFTTLRRRTSASACVRAEMSMPIPTNPKPYRRRELATRIRSMFDAPC